jgi:hypothetical protein
MYKDVKLKRLFFSIFSPFLSRKPHFASRIILSLLLIYLFVIMLMIVLMIMMMVVMGVWLIITGMRASARLGEC